MNGSTSTVKVFTASLSEVILKRGKAWPQEALIDELNSRIRRWVKSLPPAESAAGIDRINYILHEFLWRWAKRRHPQKGHKWISAKYWRPNGGRRRVFGTENKFLLTVRRSFKR